jgi:D-alanine transaminase
MEIEDWLTILDELILKNGGGNQTLYLQITRGTELQRKHRVPNNLEPTLFIMTTPAEKHTYASLSKGLTAITLEDIRWKYCDIKTTALLANVLLNHQALTNGVDEAILIKDGYAIESTASNLFIVRDDCVISPPSGHHILGGITRDLILELAVNHSIAHQERMFTKAELFAADEVWLSSSTREIRPVIKIDNLIIGSGQAGPLWQKMIALYQQYKEAL